MTGMAIRNLAMGAVFFLGCVSPSVAAVVTVFGDQSQTTTTLLAGSGSYSGTDPAASSWSADPLVTPPPTSVGGVYKSPWDSVVGAEDTTYFSVGGSVDAGGDPQGSEGVPSPVTLTYSNVQTTGEFTLFWGSIDSYNTIEFLNAGGDTLFTYTGDELAQEIGGLGVATNYEHVALVGFSEIGDYKSIRFYSEDSGGVDIAAFEFGLLTSGQAVVPLPAGLILLLSGLFGLGFLGRWKSKTSAA